MGRKLQRVRELMHKGDDIPIVPHDATLRDAIVEISDKKLGTTLIMDEDNRLLGILTDGDVRRALAEGKADATVNEIATHDLIVAFPDETLNDALLKLGMKDVGRLPVVSREDHTKLVGLITRKNILSAYNRALMARHTALDKTIQPEHFD